MINLFVTWIFDASVDRPRRRVCHGRDGADVERGVAVVIDQWRKRSGPWWQRLHWGYVAATAVFLYTTVAIMIEKPDGIKIAGAFIAARAGVLDHLAHAAQHGAAVREIRVRRRALAVPVGRAAALGVSGARAASARASHDRRKGREDSPRASAWGRRCRSCSSRRRSATPASFITTR